MSMLVTRLLKISVDREKCWLAAEHAPFFLLSCQTPFGTFKLKSLHQLTVRILPKLIEVLTLDSKENSSKLLKKAYLCFWYLVQLKAEQRFIIEKIVERRDVFGQLIEESNLPNVAYKLGGLKIVRC